MTKIKTYKGLPIFYLDSGEDTGEFDGISSIDFVDDPAIEKIGVYMNNQEEKQTIQCNLITHKEQGIVIGAYMSPEKMMIRNATEEFPNGYYISFTAEQVKLEREKFMRKRLQTQHKFMHQGIPVNAFILETWIIETEPELDKSFSVYGVQGLSKGDWVGISKVDDKEFWDTQVKDKQVHSFSIEGNFYHKPVYMNKENKTYKDIETNEDFLDFIFQN